MTGKREESRRKGDRNGEGKRVPPRFLGSQIVQPAIREGN